MQPSFWHLLKNCIFFCSKVTSKIINVNRKTFPSMLSSWLWTAYHVKIIRYQNDRLINTVILVYNSFRWNRPHFWVNVQEVRMLKVGGKYKRRLNSNCKKHLYLTGSFTVTGNVTSIENICFWNSMANFANKKKIYSVNTFPKFSKRF